MLGIAKEAHSESEHHSDKRGHLSLQESSRRACPYTYTKGMFVTCAIKGIFANFLGQKSCRTKVPGILRIFVPNFAPNFAPNFPRIFEEFSCFISWETETRKNSPKIPAIFQCKIPRQTRRKNPQKFSGERAKQKFSSVQNRHLQ